MIPSLIDLGVSMHEDDEDKDEGSPLAADVVVFVAAVETLLSTPLDCF